MLTRIILAVACLTGAVPTAYVLTEAERDLTAYVGQRLEITGVVGSSRSKADAGGVSRQGPVSAGTPAQVSETPVAHPSSATPERTVQTVKVVAGTCAGLQPAVR